MRLKETDARKPTWKPGAEVVLADGQAWHFPRPRLVYRMQIDPATRAPLPKCDARPQGETYAAWLDQLDSAENDADGLSTVTAMALDLLAQNYTIPDESVPELFAIEPGSQLSVDRWRTLGEVVRGIATYPKP